MKRTFLKSLSVIALLLTAAATPATAQENIRRSLKYTTDTSIIRCMDSVARLIYNEREEDHAFIMAYENTNVSLWMSIPLEVHVRDFKRINGKIYFCGYEDVSPNGQQAVFGYFDYVGFPGTTVYYVSNNQLLSYDRLESFQQTASESTLHLVMIASAANGISRFSDVFKYGSAWQVATTMEIPFQTHYDDIAITDSHVVISSRDTASHLWFFNKPTLSTTYTFIGNGQRIFKLTYHTNNAVLLQRMSGDSIMTFSTIPWGNHLMYTMFEGSSQADNNRRISGANNYFPLPKDMSYNREKNEIDALTHRMSSTDTLSEVYHIRKADKQPRITLFPDQRIHSISNEPTKPSVCLASGYEEGEGKLRTYRYSCKKQGRCLELALALPSNDENFDQSQPIMAPMYSPTTLYSTTMSTTYGTTKIISICGDLELK